MKNEIKIDRDKLTFPNADIPSMYARMDSLEGSKVYVFTSLEVTKDSVIIRGETGSITINTTDYSVTFDGDVTMGEASAKFFEGIAQIRKSFIDKDNQ